MDEDRLMSKYLRNIRDRLKFECNTRTQCAGRLLMTYLTQHKFWIKADSAEWICSKLEILFHLEVYYCNVIIWIPDERYGINPPCPTYNSNKNIGVHWYHAKILAQRVIGLKNHYFIMPHRYICHACKKYL